MPEYIFSLKANNSPVLEQNEPATGLATCNIEAESTKEARDIGFARFCQENPDLSQNINDYTTDVGCL